MTILNRDVRITHAMPPGRSRMRYMRLRMPVTETSEADDAETSDVRCYACSETIIGAVHAATVVGLAVQCPICGTVSEI